MSMPKPCTHETLAHNAVAHVQRCAECACVSIHIGPMTVRLDEGGLETLWAALGEACTALQQKKLEELITVSHRGVA